MDRLMVIRRSHSNFIIVISLKRLYVKITERGVQMVDITSTTQKGEEKLRQAIGDWDQKIKQGTDTVKNVVADVDKQLHQNPWPVVAGVAITFLFLGYVMGGRKQ